MLYLMEKMNWMQIEEYLKKDNRIVLPIGSIEQHGYNTVATDTQVAWEISRAVCEKTGVLLAPAMTYSFAGWATAWPGTICIKSSTLLALLTDIFESLVDQGFKRILVVNGHGQNEFAGKLALEELAWRKPETNIKFRSWWTMPKTQQIIKENGTVWGHASWFESFSWINQPGKMPTETKNRYIDEDYFTFGPQSARKLVVDGMGGGDYIKDEEFMRNFFNFAVNEMTEILEGSWEKQVYPEPPEKRAQK
jgi:creatinine amidohydrolase